MSHKSQDQRAKKRQLILAGAERVFIRKGFSGVTMKNIIEECGISRGGIYLYFSSVDEIFMEVIEQHNLLKLEQIRMDIRKNSNFEAMWDSYFLMQKERLLHMENSLVLAMFEFFIAHKHETDQNFFSEAFFSLENTISEILNCGVEAGYVNGNYVHILAANILFCIKGLETMAMSSGVKEELLDAQFGYLKHIIFGKEKPMT